MISFDTPVDRDYPVYSRGHTSVVLPGLLSPLAWTVLGPAMEAANRIIYCKQFGLISLPRDREFLVVGRFGGRLYQNASVIEVVASRGPGPSPIGEELALQGTKVSHYQRRWADGLWTLNSLPRGAYVIGRLRSWTRHFLNEVEAARLETDRALLRTDTAGLVALIERLRPGLVRGLALHGTVRSLEIAAVDGVQHLVRRAGETAETASALLSGLPGLDAAQPSLRLQGLARQLANDPTVLRAIESASYEELTRNDSGQLGWFLESFGAFLAEFGHRGFAEHDPTAPVWEEQPDHLLAVVAALAKAGERESSPGGEARRQVARQAVRALARRHRAPIVVRTEVARRLIIRSEITKSALVRHTHQIRRCLFALRAELSERLDSESVTLLSWDGLRSVAGSGPPPPPHELDRRRQELAAAAKLDAPVVFEGSFRPTADEVGHLTDLVVGLGAAPGVATGTAAVVVDPLNAPSSGSVLVATTTDTAWTPLFLTADAVITDLGSFMSHSSIVARELGIPAVVNTRNATRVIQAGQTTRVDGDRGIVFVGAAHDGPQ